jgi:YD repeat-containing protein
VPSPDGIPPIVRWQDDKWGNQIEEGYLDAANKPAVWEAGGFQKDVFTLDDHGSLKEEHFFGQDGKPVAQNGTGCYAYVYERDRSGNGTVKGCLDAQGAPLNQADTGYQKVAFQYDSSGRTVGNQYYDRDGKPVVDKRTIGPQSRDGCFGWLWGYDQNFNRTISVCLDASGKAYDLKQLLSLAETSHEVAFDFARSFELDQQLVAQDPTPGYHLQLEEAALTANRFDVCMAQAASIKDSDLNSYLLLVRDALLLACQFADGKKSAARATASSLAGRLNQVPEADWTFSGTRYYIQTSSHFQVGSDAWDKLFHSLQKGDGQGVADALNQLQPLLKD